MSHFYGVMKGAAREVTRRAHSTTGLTVIAASWSGAVKTTLYVDAKGRDCYRVEQMQWQNGAGVRYVIAEGVIGVKS